MQRRRISKEDKYRLAEAHANGEDYVEVARTLGIKRGTAWSIIRRHQDQDPIKFEDRGGARNVKLDEEIGRAAAAVVEEHPEFTLNQINSEVRLLLPNKPRICISTLRKALQGQLITIKKLEHADQDRNSDQVKAARQMYAEWLLQNEQEIIFVDESGFHLWLSRTRGRAVRGQRAVRVVGARKGPHFTLILAVSNQRGVIHRSFHTGGTTIERFNGFLEDWSLQAGDNRILTYVMDNASCHRRAADAMIPGNHVVRHLPAYSPFCNICENAFSTWKAALKRSLAEIRPQLLHQPHQQQLSDLCQLGEQSLDSITTGMCQHWFNETRKLIPRMVRQDDILQDHA